MANIDWRAFWASAATVIICLLIYAIVLEPVIKKYKIQVVNPNEPEDVKAPESKKA